MRIGLFTEQDSRAEGSLAATVDALVAHRPFDASIIEYPAPANLKALLCARELVNTRGRRFASTSCLSRRQTACDGRAAYRVELRLPLIGSCPSSSFGRERSVEGLSAASLVRPAAAGDVDGGARELIATGISTSKILLWRPGVDTSMFAPTALAAAS